MQNIQCLLKLSSKACILLMKNHLYQFYEKLVVVFSTYPTLDNQFEAVTFKQRFENLKEQV